MVMMRLPLLYNTNNTNTYYTSDNNIRYDNDTNDATTTNNDTNEY